MAGEQFGNKSLALLTYDVPVARTRIKSSYESFEYEDGGKEDGKKACK